MSLRGQSGGREGEEATLDIYGLSFQQIHQQADWYHRNRISVNNPMDKGIVSIFLNPETKAKESNDLSNAKNMKAGIRA